MLWVHLRSTRLPLVISCVVSGTVYHPPSADDRSMLDYLFTPLTSIEGLYPGCGILFSGDFNRLNVNCLLNQFRLKQLVRKPTRGSKILDLIITNMSQAYDKQFVDIYPPFGLSDHNAILLYPKLRSPLISSRRTVKRRETRPSKKIELGR